MARDGREHLLPLVSLFALAGGVLDPMIGSDRAPAAIEAVLDISAAEVAGSKPTRPPSHSTPARACQLHYCPDDSGPL